MEALLAGRSVVGDVAVLRRIADDGRPVRVVYVVPAPGVEPAAVHRAVAAADLRTGAGGSPPLLIGVVSRIPRDPDGLPDAEALRALPVTDPRQPGGAPAAAPDPVLGRLHLDRLLDLPPRWAPDATAPTPAAGAGLDLDDGGPSSLCTGSDPGPDPGPHRRDADPAIVVDAMLAAAHDHPDRGVHVVGPAGERFVDYPTLLGSARRVLTALRATGLGAGDPVILHLPDLGDHLVGLWACLLGGMRPVAVAQAPGYHDRNAVLDKLEHAWRTLGSAPVLSGGATVAALRGYGDRHGWDGLRVLDLADQRDADPAAELHRPRPDEVAFLQLSSGSTGRSKVIQITHTGVIRYAQAARLVGRMRDGDVFVNWLPLDHVVGTLSFHLAPVVLGCDNVHAPTALVLADPLLWLDLLQRHRAAHSWAPNFGFKLVADAVRARPDRRWDLGTVRTLVNAGEQCTEPVMAEFVAAVEPFGITPGTVVLGWGMAETCTMICHQPLGVEAIQHVRRAGVGRRLRLLDAPEPGSSTLLSMGPPDPGTECRIVGPDGAVLPELAIGRLQVRSARVTPGYLNNPTADADAFVGDGWFDTGDLALTAGGRVTITGRAKEIIIVNAVHHFCHEIEDVVGAVDGVTPSFVAAVGVPSPSGTEDLAVLLVPRVAPVDRSVLAAVRAALARRLQLTSAVLVAVPGKDFDKTTSGKIQRAAMRARLLSGDLDDAVRAVELAEAGPRTVPDCLYRPQWTPRRFPARPVAAGPTLVIADELGLAGLLPQTVVAPPSGWRATLESLRNNGTIPDRIVYAASYLDTPPLDDPDTALRRCSTDLLDLHAALAADDWAGELVTVSRGLHRVRGDEPGCYPAATTAALAEVIAAERPSVRAWHLDLPGADVRQDAAVLVETAGWAHHEPLVAWRGVPHVRSLRRVDPTPVSVSASDPASASDVGPDGPEPGSCWLVTGGLGGVGRHLLRTLTVELGLRLLVLGRSAGRSVAEGAAGTGGAGGVDLAGGVDGAGGVAGVDLAAVDIADGDALRRAVADAERRWDAPLAGVLHLAGDYDVRLLQDIDERGWRDRTAAKIAGSLNLARLLLDRPGAQLIAFSSLVSLLPAVGTASYAAGNRFLEALCEHLGDRVPVRCLSWGLWRGVGISAEHGYTEQLSRDRVLALSATEGVALFRLALRQNTGHLLVGIDPAATAVSAMVEPPRPLAAVRSDAGQQAPTDPLGPPTPTVPGVAAVPARLRDQPAPVPAAAMARTIRDALREVGRADIDQHASFYEAGIDSVRLLQIHAKLQRATGTEFPQTAFFSHPTVASLADHLAGVPGADIIVASSGGDAADRRIAIIGMAVRFPDADTVDRYWANAVAGRVSLRRFDRAELLAAGLPAALVDDPEYVPVSGSIGDISGFDAELFGITGREAALTDPQQRLFLQVCHQALEHGGHTGAGATVGVYAGSGMHLYSLRSYLLENLAGTDRGDQSTALQVAIGNQPDFLATRVAHRLGLTGPAVTVQTACSTSLVAVHLACQALLAGETDLALAGAAAVHVPHAAGYRYQEGSILSRRGTCRAFDADADGTVGGNGVAAVLLKRLDAALADGDTVHGVILGSAINNDGAAKAGYTAPSAAGQARVVRAALAAARVEPSSIGYVETHGTGTRLGDPIELDGLREVFGGRTTPLPLGSAKPNIGHLDSCAGLAGLVKAVQALAHATVPPLAGLRTPNPELRLDDGPFELPTVPAPWPIDGPRRAGVSAFGIGGTNAHVVLEQAPAAVDVPGEASPMMVPLSAHNATALAELAAHTADALVALPPPSARDVLRTLGIGRRHRRERVLAWGDSPADAAAALRAFAGGEAGNHRGGTVSAVGQLVLAFTGQGADCTGMARGLVDRYPSVRQVLDECDAYYREHWGASLLEPLLAERHEWTTELVQPALFAVQVGLARLLDTLGIRPDALVGHSAGEYAALCVGGALSVTDGLHLTAVRGSLLQRTAPGAMLAVLGDLAAVRAATTGITGVELAVRNGSTNHVLAGTPDAIDRAENAVERAGIATHRLPTDRAFHSALLDPVLDELAGHAATVTWRPLRLPVVSNLDGVRHEPGTVLGPDHVRRQTREPADYRGAIDALVADGHDTFVELGPDAVLCRLGRSWPGATWIPTLPRGGDPVVAALGALYGRGVDPDWAAFASGGRRIPLPTYPFQPRRHWIDPPQAPVTEGQPAMPPAEVGLTTVVCQRVRELTARQLGEDLDTVTDDRGFLDLGADSLLIINLLRELQAIFGVRVAMRELFEEADTPARVAALIAERIDPARAAELTAASTPALSPHPAATAQPAPAAAPSVVTPPASAPPSPPVTPAAPAAETLAAAVSAPGLPVTPVPPPAPLVPTPSLGSEVPLVGVEAVVAEQLQLLNRVSHLMTEQLAAMNGRLAAPAPPVAQTPPAAQVPIPPPAPGHTPPPTAPTPAPPTPVPSQLGPQVRGASGSGMTTGALDARQREHVDALVDRYSVRTARSKEIAQRYRRPLADSRAVVGFRRATKELLYPIAGHRAAGAYLEDVDGNTYVDITMGFGALMFGHEPPFVSDAVREHLDRGLQLGPRNEETGQAAELLCELTGMDRAAFATTGTEANSAAFRLARAFTGRDMIVTFDGSYHGHFDPVLGRTVGDGDRLRTVPVSAGIPDSAVSELVVLEYGAERSLDAIRRGADRIAVVVVEVVASRHPERRPVEFVRALRQLCDQHGIVLMFDEMLTGFRPHPRGAAGVFDVRPDLATYGKVLGGGYPIGAIAGRAEIMDWIDGGFWRYGDDSTPGGETTFFGGTYIQHPVSMVAAKAVLTHLRDNGPALQDRLTAHTDRLAAELNRFCADGEFPLRVNHFGSMFRFAHRGNVELLFAHLILENVHVWEWRNFFLSTAHTDADVDFVIDAVRSSLTELRRGGFLPGGTTPAASRPRRSAPVIQKTAAAPARAAAVARASAAAVGSAPAGAAPAAVPARALVRPERRTHAVETPDTRYRDDGHAGGGEQGRTRPDFSVYFFGDYPRDGEGDKYRVVLEAAEFADRGGLHAVWLPERHFHSFGGVFPNPSVLAAALATRTTRVRLNAGSVVLPLHDPIRVAEEWSVVDNLSGGRVGLGCASGWHATDFVLAPDTYGRHKEAMYEGLDVIRSLWRGDAVERVAGNGEQVRVQLYPRPLQAMPPFYTAIVGNPDSYRRAAAEDIGIITNLMSQSVEQLAENIALYRDTRAEHGLDPAAGRVVVLLHSYLGADGEQVRGEAFEPFCDYLRSSLSLFGQVTNSLGFTIDLDNTEADDVEYMLRRAYERYCADRALIGTPAECEPIVRRLAELGVDEIACFLDFGVDADRVIAALPFIADLRGAFADGATEAAQEASAPMSPAQRQVWTQERLLPGRPTYTESVVLRIDGPLDAGLLRRALQAVVDRHAGLRTVFREVDGEPSQVVLPSHTVELPVLRFEGSTDDAARQAIDEETAHVFDLAAGPLFDPRLLAGSDDTHLLVLRMHHLVMDTWSAGIVTREVSAHYRAAVEGRPVPDLDEPGDPLAPKESVADATDLEHWTRRYRDRPAELELPTDRPRGPGSGGRAGTAGILLDGDLTDRVRRCAVAHRATPFMVLLAGFAVVLRRLSGQDDLVVGTPMASRPPGTENTVGFHVSTLPLRITVADDPGFADLLGAVRAEVFDATEHGAVPVDDLVATVAGDHDDPSRHPLFGVCVEFDNEAAFQFDLPGLRTTALDVAVARAPFDLTVILTPADGGLRCRVNYDADLFDPSTVDRMLAHFRFVVDEVTADPGRPLSELPVPPADEALLADWQEGPEPTGSGPTGVAPMLHSRDDAGCAVVDGDRTVPWAELDRRADAVAAELHAAGVRPDQVVAVHLPRGADAVAAMLGVLRRGAAYLPLDPEHPRPRLSAMVDTARAVAVVTRSDLPPPPGDGLPVIRVDAVPEPVAAEPSGAEPDAAQLREPGADPSRVAYVLFTSGSTGSPKGAVVEHRSIANTVAWYIERLGITAADRVCWFSSPGFDASCTDVWPAIRTGATLHVVPPALRFDPQRLRDWLVDTGISALFLPTKLGEALLRLDWSAHDRIPLRHLVMGGELMRAAVPDGLPFEVLNAYGATEATVYTTWSSLPVGGGSAAGPPPIGRPMPGNLVLVLDIAGRPVPIGAVGELHLGGVQVARGYAAAPDETARRFVTHPVHGRLYRTGDLVRWGSDGQLRYVGRNDDQVQIRGQRTEPGEVEHQLRLLDGVADAAVTTGTDQHGDPYLAAHIVPHATRPAPSTVELADLLRQSLPSYLVPTRWAVLDRLPVNANGKLDRAALPEPELPTQPDTGDDGAPGSELERRLHDLWCEQLELDTIDVGSSFFQLGGNSLTVMRLLNRVRAQFGSNIGALDFFSNPTVRGMATLIEEDTQRPVSVR